MIANTSNRVTKETRWLTTSQRKVKRHHSSEKVILDFCFWFVYFSVCNEDGRAEISAEISIFPFFFFFTGYKSPHSVSLSKCLASAVSEIIYLTTFLHALRKDETKAEMFFVHKRREYRFIKVIFFINYPSVYLSGFKYSFHIGS